ncbi:MCE family protein [Mycolicibacterium arenosum]|uniref:MCE family protein n=1 Tax=Mycolicibacterium arenosum TaxID=2952157 RepID=A0ABT1M264_9MYCO|nr:MCE family protein [Mycolicibacterium sp. CAU 1645]MCP9272945.1 MCE family protein [Mycolicibacterium sp. CAU 1645]
MTRARIRSALAGLLACLLVAGTCVVVRATYFGPTRLTAVFANATGIYPGDEVRVSGVKVGTIESIRPDVTQATLTLEVDHGVSVPAEASAIIVAQNLVSSRYVQLTPAYRDTGAVLRDGDAIPLDRTAVPVEWDQVKDQLTRLATELGPNGDVSGTAVTRFVDSAANAMDDGNGAKLRATLRELAGISRIMSSGSGNLVDIIASLQKFISTLRDSNQQIIQFQDRLATLTSVVDGSRSDLDAALRNVSDVIGEVQRFVKGTRDHTVEQIQRLNNVTQNMVDHRKDLEQVLHVAPTAIANQYNIFDPRTGGATGVFVLSNLSNPKLLLCGMLGAIENVTATTTGKLCNQTLGPALDSVSLNYLPFPFSPVLTSAPGPEDLIYSDPALMPGASGTPAQIESPPSVSAYTGLGGDVPPPPGYGPPPGPPPDLQGMLLPAGPLPAEAPDPPPADVPAGGTPP